MDIANRTTDKIPKGINAFPEELLSCNRFTVPASNIHIAKRFDNGINETYRITKGNTW